MAAEVAWRPEGPVVCVELKPKWGFASTCPTVRPQDAAIKRGASRFSLYHLLKGERGEVGVPSRQALIVTECEHNICLNSLMIGTHVGSVFAHVSVQLDVFTDDNGILLHHSVFSPSSTQGQGFGSQFWGTPTPMHVSMQV